MHSHTPFCPGMYCTFSECIIPFVTKQSFPRLELYLGTAIAGPKKPETKKFCNQCLFHNLHVLHEPFRDLGLLFQDIDEREPRKMANKRDKIAPTA